jgi:hypothetical protein
MAQLALLAKNPHYAHLPASFERFTYELNRKRSKFERKGLISTVIFNHAALDSTIAFERPPSQRPRRASMNRTLIVCIAALALVAIGFSKQAPGSASEHVPPLVEVVHLIGDQRDGFRQSCLLIYADGRYHRETRQQEQRSGRPTFRWYAPKVFESVIGADDLRRLREIVESENFRAISGTVGDPAYFMSRLVIGPDGVKPHDAIDIFEASLSHSDSSQVFAVVRGTASRELENRLGPFVAWVGEVEKRKEGRLDKDAAGGCAMSLSPGAASSWQLTTNLVPKPIYSPEPEYPINGANTKRTEAVLVHVVVNVDGSVGSASVKHGIDPVLDGKALDAVTKWKLHLPNSPEWPSR